MKEYDFYYSETQESIIREYKRMMGEKYNHCTVNGIVYTEMIEKGKKPLSNFDDLKLIYSGTDEGVKVKFI
jgi:hypothetical protein